MFAFVAREITAICDDVNHSEARPVSNDTCLASLFRQLGKFMEIGLTCQNNGKVCLPNFVLGYFRVPSLASL